MILLLYLSDINSIHVDVPLCMIVSRESRYAFDVRVRFSYRNMMRHRILPPIRRSYTHTYTHSTTHALIAIASNRIYSYVFLSIHHPMNRIGCTNIHTHLHIYVNLKLDMMSNIVKAFSIGLSLSIAIRMPATQYICFI